MFESRFREFAREIDGAFYFDLARRSIYATDASAYREMPLAVAYPRNNDDIKKLIGLARELKTSLVPRTAGTSLAGQVVGHGIVVDVSRFMTEVLEINKEASYVRVQPGVIRDVLNQHLTEYDLLFGPETATANRAMIGGMVGNNSCGSNSIVYGSTRDHLISVKMILADGEEVEFRELNRDEYLKKIDGSGCVSGLENAIYRTTHTILQDPENQEEIKKEFPKPEIKRRNTGYALDLLMESFPFTGTDKPFNMCRLIAGSEGTLGIITEIKLHVDPLPPPHKALICAHFESLYESLEANLIALKYHPHASELIDHYILDCTKENIAQRKNRFFVKGDPKAILIVELARDDKKDLDKTVNDLISDFNKAGYGYHYPVLEGDDMARIWALRKAGLGLLSNLPGDAKPVPVVEDTAVDVNDLPAYIRDFNQILKKYGLYSVHYAHAGSGELHLRPIIDLKTSDGQKIFKIILDEVAHLVKKYNGSLSGEHGDGRLRGEFIPFMIGEKNYRLLEEIKEAWDPDHLFNPGKIVRTPSMNTSLRYKPDQGTREIDTYFDFSKTKGVLRATEQCNGSGDCRKLVSAGGTMCPSYMATKDEKDTTRARANILREMLTHSTKHNPFDHKEIYEVLDLCLSCKGCKSECPSNVDMAKLKAEFLQHYYEANGTPLRTRMIGNLNNLNAMNARFAGLYNRITGSALMRNMQSSLLGFSEKRTLPAIHKITLKKWSNQFPNALKSGRTGTIKTIFLYADEFTNYYDVEIGKAAIELLTGLGYEVIIPDLKESGRTWLSKGLLKSAKKLAQKNIRFLDELMDESSVLIGIEPSAILSFRDEYPALADPAIRLRAEEIAERCKTIEEFIYEEYKHGNIESGAFTQSGETILIHGHCHQKALSSESITREILSIPEHYEASLIPSGCCGMAGSFGYEKEHYELSMQIGELVLFPAVRNSDPGTIIAAAGTSCRHQIMDGTGVKALHPVEILRNALKQEG